MIPNHISEVLQTIATQLQGCGIEWVVTGSAGIALQGIPITPVDVDIQSTAEGIYLVEKCLLSYVKQSVTRVETDSIHSHIGQLTIHNTRVELFGDFDRKAAAVEAGWVAPVNIHKYRLFVDLNGFVLPVLSLETELDTYRRLGRSERVEMIQDWLASNLHIEPAGPDQLDEYAQVPISFTIRSVLRAEPQNGGLGGIRLIEEAVFPPVFKDYDTLPYDASGTETGGPRSWPAEFDVANWTFLLAKVGADVVGAAAIAWNTPGVHMLEGKNDLAVLWDLRVHPEYRRRGVGSLLMWQAAAWARSKKCTRLKIETQNNNVAACRFYTSLGCQLGAIHRFAYAGSPPVAQEAMLLWYLDLVA
jgi:ribosomal protein S18 acetylase RimI-like enzyme